MFIIYTPLLASPSPFDPKENCLLEKYSKLNNKGRDKLIEYAIAKAVSVIDVPATVNVSPFPKPRPHTKITPAIIRFLDFVRSTLFSTTFLTPIAEIIP